MRSGVFATRNYKEVVRDPLSVVLGLLVPLGLLAMFALIGRSAPAEVFELEYFAPGMIVFGYTFLTLFIATLMAKDRDTSFLLRLFASPLTAADYVMGYALPLLPVAVVQAVAAYALASLLGLPLDLGIVWSLLASLPTAVMAVCVGVAMGALLSQSQVIGVGVGNIYIIVGSLFGGAWMDLDVLGGALKTTAYLLPFAHGVDAARQALSADFSGIAGHLAWVLGYALVAAVVAVIAIKKRMRG